MNATLWALGTYVAIWVDDSVAIDWDEDCDGFPEHPAARNSYGFDNCDLADIANIVDTNIYPNLVGLFGEPSDVNGDGLITVLITPVLNAMPTTSDTEEYWSQVVESYAEPAVDLEEFDSEGNPGSNEQEVIYVFAPDPEGFFNFSYKIDTDEYTSVTLAGRIAVVLAELISYNQHVLVQEGEAEQAWLTYALGALAADLTGFGAIFHDDAWDYLDTPHLNALVEDTSDGSLAGTARGAQYLFARWLVDTMGTGILAPLVQTSSVGTTNIEEAVSSFGIDKTFDELVLQWQMALLTTGVQDIDGAPLVDSGEWPPFADATTLTASTTPVAGEYYGANGYQMGINLHGRNMFVEGGTTADPQERASLEVNLANTDFLTYVPGFPFYGYVEGNYAAQVIRLKGIEYDQATMNFQTSGDGLLAAIVRWNDPVIDDVTVEDIYSATDANALDLSDLPTDGTAIYAVGEISIPGKTNVVDAAGEVTATDVPDTDRWRLDLSDRSASTPIRVVIWMERHYTNDDGEATLSDPWIAVLPEEWVPAPTVDDYTRAICPAAGAPDFGYPSSVLDYLYYQLFLSSESGVSSDGSGTGGSGGSSGGSTGDTGEEEDFCTSVTTPSESDTGSDPLTCANDWDQDEIRDEDEYTPTNLLEQVWFTQCLYGAATEDLATEDWFDVDQRDKDSAATYSRVENIGGYALGDDEEAYLDVTLSGRQSYLIIVGDEGGGNGSYELTIREMVE